MVASREDTLSIVKHLADGFSNQSRQANRFWLASVVAAAVVVFPKHSGGNVVLPFSLGEVPNSIYGPIGFGILFVLFMAYCQAYAQAHNAANFAHNYINGLKRSDTQVDARRFFDFLVISSFARASPLAEVLKSSSQKIPARITIIFYVILKILAHTIILGLPLSALLFAYCRILEHAESILIKLPLLIALVFAVIATILLIFAEFVYGQRVVVHFKSPRNARK
jgi:hypothetical protein